MTFFAYGNILIFNIIITFNIIYSYINIAMLRYCLITQCNTTHPRNKRYSSKKKFLENKVENHF